ncbi:MAG: sigma-54 dependent transcriptional regulator, partial [Desulfobacterales bacterium]|nr:sigma-54 dependent transcriptional regulator [Desulfobacterales bacterium]
DVNLPDGNGLDALATIKQQADPPLVIIITAHGSTEGAKLSITNGAWDYIEKPFYKDKLLLQVRRALEYRRAKQAQKKKVVLSNPGLVGKSPALTACLEKVARSAGSQVNVLIHGESGTGKELLARLIHDNSECKTNEYVVVDCASLPETLIESTLFGHKKGAFTSADKASDGLIAMANGGTLFLDEIGELPLSAQKTFLRVLQEKKYRPVGSAVERSSEFRLISATNRNLEKMVTEGSFREDLFHRLKTFLVRVPPLRDRNGDVKVLAHHYTDKLCAQHGLPAKALLPETLAILEAYHWPGNVRELINVLEQALLTDPALELVYPMALPNKLRVAYLEKGMEVKTHHPDPPPPKDPNIPLPPFKEYRAQAIEAMEEDYFRKLLTRCDNDIDRVADLSGLSKNRVYHYIRKFDLKSA